MNYYYSDASNQPIGPRTEEQMRQLHRNGKLGDGSWVLVEGAAKWVPYASVFPPWTTPASHQANPPGLPPIITAGNKPPVIQQKRGPSSFLIVAAVAGSLVGLIVVAVIVLRLVVGGSGGSFTGFGPRLSQAELDARISQYIGVWRCEQTDRNLEILKGGSWSFTRPSGRVNEWRALRDGSIIMESTGTLTSGNQAIGTSTHKDKATIVDGNLLIHVYPYVFTYKRLR